jgi:hypothetical protein
VGKHEAKKIPFAYTYATTRNFRFPLSMTAPGGLSGSGDL